jgi:hypothetical protein
VEEGKLLLWRNYGGKPFWNTLEQVFFSISIWNSSSLAVRSSSALNRASAPDFQRAKDVNAGIVEAFLGANDKVSIQSHL